MAGARKKSVQFSRIYLPKTPLIYLWGSARSNPGRPKGFPAGQIRDAYDLVNVGVGISTLYGSDLGCVTLCCRSCDRRLACVRSGWKHRSRTVVGDRFTARQLMETTAGRNVDRRRVINEVIKGFDRVAANLEDVIAFNADTPFMSPI